MHFELQRILQDLDARWPALSANQIPLELEMIPMEVFGMLQIDRPPELVNLLKWMPSMPPAEVQQLWTGNSGHELMKQSICFLKSTVSKYREVAQKPLHEGMVLDYGCGWGRLIRLLYKHFPGDNIYGCDPWDESLAWCRQGRLHGTFFQSDYLPETLPLSDSVQFDLIIAFSVFTHLSERSFKMSAEVLMDRLSDDGLLALTIRPREYWDHIFGTTPFFSKIPLQQVREAHDLDRHAFYPHPKKIHRGEVVYGETTVSPEYLKKAFGKLEITGIEWSETDPFQIIIFLQKKKTR